MTAHWAGPDSLDDLATLRKAVPGHIPPVRDHCGFELTVHPLAAAEEIDKLDNVRIPPDWTRPVVYPTRSSMHADRRAAVRPDPSYDVDGDGFVSQDDYRIAKAHDVSLTGTLTKAERDKAITDRSHYMGTRLHDDEIGGNARARRLMSSLRGELDGGQGHLTDRYMLNRRMKHADVSIRSLKQRSSHQLKDCLFGSAVEQPRGTGDGPVFTRTMLLDRRKADTARSAAAASEAFAATWMRK